MINFTNKIFIKEYKDIKELLEKSDNLSEREIMVTPNIYNKAEKIAKVLNTNVEGVFVFAAYRLTGTRVNPFTPEK